MKFRKAAATLAIGLLVGIACLATPSRAEDYPTRTITLIVPFPPGGPSDVVARIVADGMSRVLNQTIIIENVGGAGGTIGTARVAAATPDGYTLLAASMGSHVATPVLTPGIRYDSIKDFEPIGLTANAPVAVVARKHFPAKDLKEFIAYVKDHGDSVKQAHGGIGASSHMACLLITSQLGLKPEIDSLSRHRARAQRPHRRPRRFLLRAGGQRCPGGEGKIVQGLCGVGRHALSGFTGCALGQGSRYSGIPTQHLERAAGAERNAERRPRQA